MILRIPIGGILEGTTQYVDKDTHMKTPDN